MGNRRLLLAAAELDFGSTLSFDPDTVLGTVDPKLSKPEQDARATAARRCCLNIRPTGDGFSTSAHPNCCWRQS